MISVLPPKLVTLDTDTFDRKLLPQRKTIIEVQWLQSQSQDIPEVPKAGNEAE